MTNTTKPFPLRTPGGGQPPAKELPTVSQKQVSLCLSQSCAAAPAFWVEVTIYFLDPKPRPGFSIWPQSRPFECHAPWAVYKRALFFHPRIPRASMQMFLPGLERPRTPKHTSALRLVCYPALSGNVPRLLNPQRNAFCALQQFRIFCSTCVEGSWERRLRWKVCT